MNILAKTLSLFFIIYMLFTAAYAETTEKTTLGASGYPIPRFMTLTNDKTYMRTGPGREYPIDWIYLKENYPLKVIAEYGYWRKVVDVDQTTGWILRSLLSLSRKALIINGPQKLVKSPEDPNKVTVIAEENVIGNILQCENTWCELEVGGITGWIKQENIWGTLEQETFD